MTTLQGLGQSRVLNLVGRTTASSPTTVGGRRNKLKSLSQLLLHLGKNIRDFSKSTKYFISTFKQSCLFRGSLTTIAVSNADKNNIIICRMSAYRRSSHLECWPLSPVESVLSQAKSGLCITGHGRH